MYRYLPTFLFEKKFSRAEDVIARLYDEGLADSPIHKASIGYRLPEETWGQGIATENAPDACERIAG